jgi:diketogulonate reductase-like aldo/keto reductase
MLTVTPSSDAGASFPRFLYGTAWKEDRTERLTRLALDAGFVGIDAANQRKHYYEAGVGAALRSAIAAGVSTRAGLFLQTKFTFLDGQDHRLPYDRAANVTTQVAQSFESSLEHLGTDYLDSYVLHGPSRRQGLAAADFEAWRAMEALVKRGAVRHLGVSNVSLDQLRLLCEEASVPPRFVQNRCYARTGWDRAIRAYCAQRGIIYQGFSLLTANARELTLAPIARAAARAERSPVEVVFRFALALGMLPLTGTSNPEHMRLDLASATFDLLPAEIAAIERISG